MQIPGVTFSITNLTAAIVALVLGIIFIIFPFVLGYIVGAFLIVVSILYFVKKQ
jgi:hypothetical protein